MKYWYWQNIALSIGIQIQYIIGKGYVDSVHSDFDVDMIDWEKFISNTDQS